MIDTTDKIGTISYNGVPLEVDKNLSTKTITQNGTYAASSDSVDGYSEVTVNVPAAQPNLGTKTITTNGTYAASSDSLDGYSSVTVNVSGGGGSGDPTFKQYMQIKNTGNYLFAGMPVTIAQVSTFLDGITTSSWTTWISAFANCSNITQIPDLDNSSTEYCNLMFYGSGLTGSIDFQTFQNFQTADITDMGGMFGQTSITSISNFDVSNATNMSGAFENCTSLETVTFTNWGAESTEYNLYGLFMGCESLQRVTGIDWGTVLEIGDMFNGCYSLEYIGDSLADLQISYLDISASTEFSAAYLSQIVNSLPSFASEGEGEGEGEGESVEEHYLILGEDNLAKLSQNDIDGATAKGWTLA